MRFANYIAQFFVILALLAAPLAAKAESPVAEKNATARLVANVTGSKGLDFLFLGVDVALKDGWKTYWRTPGDAGLAPVFDWVESKNTGKSRVYYPAPHRFTVAGLDNFGYKERVVFPIMLRPENKEKPVKVRLKLSILVCNEICVPEKFDLSLDIPATKPDPSSDVDLIVQSLQQVPVTVPPRALYPEHLWFDSEKRGLELRVTAAQKPLSLDVFVENEDQHVFGKPDYKFTPARNELAVHIPLNGKAASNEALLASLSKKDPIITVVTENLRVEKTMKVLAAPPVDVTQGAASMPLLALSVSPALILLAFLGGIILNLMPCVLPVLSLKVLAALHLSAKERNEARMGFLAGALGILSSFWLLAAILAGLKAGGSAIGWGIQFQHPVFLGFLIVVILLFAFNLAGFFEIPLPRFVADRFNGTDHRHPTVIGHFLTGMFATLLATPCTAPFLGSAVGFALSAGLADIVIIFTFMGLGLALPWIVFAAFPALALALPKPGHWMITLRRVLAAALLITALWLATVFYAVVKPAKDIVTPVGWTAFSTELVETEAAKGRIMLVDVTADWCLTCKANKKFVLESDAVIKKLDSYHALLVRADWTKPDENIRAFLEKHGRFGIPFNIVYGPAARSGIVLPELLTEKAVLDALKKAAGQ